MPAAAPVPVLASAPPDPLPASSEPTPPFPTAVTVDRTSGRALEAPR